MKGADPFFDLTELFLLYAWIGQWKDGQTRLEMEETDVYSAGGRKDRFGRPVVDHTDGDNYRQPVS